MEEPREGSEPMEEAGKRLILSSKTETLVSEDANTLEVSDDKTKNDQGLASGDGSLKAGNEKQERAGVEDMVGSVKGDESNTVASDDAETEMECERDTGTVEVKLNDETAKSKNGASHETVGEEETLVSAANDKAICEVEDNGGACDAEQNVEAEKSQQKSINGETLSIADQDEEITNKSEEDSNKLGVDSKQDKEDNEQGYSESAQVPEESSQLSKEETGKQNPGPVAEIYREEEITNVNQKEENGEAMEIDYAAEEQVEKAANDTAGAGMVQAQDVLIAEADSNDSNVVKEMEIDGSKDNTDIASHLTRTIKSADSANRNSPARDAAPGEVEPLDHTALFDPTSDITNFIDFSGVSSWSGNIQDLKPETGNVSLKEDKKDTDMAEDISMVDCSENLKSGDATVNSGSRDKLSFSAQGIENESNEGLGAATDCSKEASDAILGSSENQEDKVHQCLDKNTANQQDTMREEDDSAHEAPSIDPNQMEDIEMEEPNNSDFADDETGSDIKTNGVKRKADVLSEDSPGEGRKTVTFAKVSFVQRPSFKIGACIARAASQMAGSPSVLKGSNFGDETLAVESFVFQLHCAATDPVKENVVSDIAAGFFLDFRNSSALQQVAPEKLSSKRVKLLNSNAGGTEAFEFEEMGDTYWTDRVIHNGGEEQTPTTEKGNYQVVPVELKAAQVQRTRRPYRRRQSQISIPHSASENPTDFDENAPAELIMKFSETDTIPPEKSLSKMFRHFGPIRESQTEVDREKHRARVVFKKVADAEVVYNSVGRFNIFGTKVVKYELSHTITETFKVQPYVVSLGEKDAALCPPS